MDVAFEGFCGAVRGGTLWTSEAARARLRELRAGAAAGGLAGQGALPGLAGLLAERRAAADQDARLFTCLYRFAFFILREFPEKNLRLDVAEKAWAMLLEGRFRLLPEWLKFVHGCGRVAVTDDTWTQVLEFTRQVRTDLSNFDPLGAWPVLVDDFAESLFAERARRACAGSPSNPAAFPDAPPASGWKRASRDPVLDLARQVGLLETEGGGGASTAAAQTQIQMQMHLELSESACAWADRGAPSRLPPP